jgi:hypothetical protein
MARTKVSKKASDESIVKPATLTETAAAVPAVETAAATTSEATLKKTVPQPAPAQSEISKPKPTLVKGEPRANLVPINLEDEIRRLAYLLSERRGFVPGHENEDWLAAEHEVRERYHQSPAQHTA